MEEENFSREKSNELGLQSEDLLEQTYQKEADMLMRNISSTVL